MATIFSRIVAGEIPSYKVAENERFYAFLDIAPLAKGHTLVIPKREVDYFYDLEDDELQEMIVFAKQIAKKIQATTQCKKVATVVLGLEVPHAHIHLVPMNTEKDVDFSAKKLELSTEEFIEIANSLQ
jgi:histidine triad (HIT) family protein